MFYPYIVATFNWNVLFCLGISNYNMEETLAWTHAEWEIFPKWTPEGLDFELTNIFPEGKEHFTLTDTQLPILEDTVNKLMAFWL